ncbi:bifunctional sugar phosphate isomerase/epimerase/4-hydroxyphenylpyruvate dioxygenase family protein [Tateyamaria sp. Alg231-49]|uniref:bifunctional sugar phosphate isomerase/epimerase/4-hydroxyphenylpyruvate dioxygenase family protein n=1 Tax=Tateyamaria sp. Alg231-49 TaxID=1922219 RepID=UPI000D558A82|nr:sugar phosphate isomerase/epimerase and 4-hydroxyphenylpyruvate domain-containing protein [Tateyamaria sp. Alg231-49]
MTHLSIATTSVPGDLLQKLDTMAAAGFSGVELHEPDLTSFSGSAKDVAEHASKLGLTIDVFQPFHDFEGLTGAERQAAFARLDQKLALMRDLEAKTLLVGTTTRKDASGVPVGVVADFKELAERVGKAGCRAALIALPWASQIRRELDAFAVVEAVDSPHFGLAVNSFFSLADGSKAARLRDIPGDRIFHVQMSDAPALDFDISHLKSHFGVLPGQGGLNLASLVRVLARAGYAGPWSLARVSATAADSRDTYARDGYRALVSLLDDVARSEPKVAQPLPDLPGRVHATGFEFIEFAVDAPAKTTLTSVLSALSFRKERNHRSKAVELWRQGAVNIVINSEAKGFAAEARKGHGPGVCDMGLRVADAGQTVKRALMLGAPAFSQPVGSGELDIPAIKGVGGSVVHFIDEKSDLHRVWDIEFDPTPKACAPQPAGLRRIDHVAQTMRYQDMQSWLTYYLSTFQMEKADMVDVVDPSGLILSQALSSPEGEVRLNLNGAGGQATFAGTFLSKGDGAGVQHIALASDDIFETSEQLQSTGFERLTIAANYYDDLQTRFGLEDEMINALRAGNILYDRDGRGAYFQIYSASFWGGFFFEIVERRGGYDGYGARNAPIRLAAQMQHTKQAEFA